MAIMHRDPKRFALLYRLLWRLLHEPALRRDPLDQDVVQAERMAKAVRRERHKLKAFVRFRPVDDGNGQSLHIAWFEPEHRVVDSVVPFFARRFANMRWALLTPRRSVHWDGNQLHRGEGARREEAPAADDGEQFWLTYYNSIFNPARLKVAAMQREMPKRYWRNLPEAVCIAPLIATAAQRSSHMIARPPSDPLRKLPSATPPPVRPSPSGLDELREAVEKCRGCPIGEHATQAVIGEGPLNARLMIVGEQPGDQEDLRGRPFVGPAGQVFDRAVQQLGWQRDGLYLTNAVKHFKYEPRGKRRIHKTPAQREAAACQQWLEDEIALVRPERIIALGATAARSLLGRDISVTQERGRWLRRVDGRDVLIAFHPSALLRIPGAEAREHAYQQWVGDLQEAAAFAA